MKNAQEYIPRILIVDDEKIFRSSTAQTLTDEGFEVTEASNGKDAIESARHHSFDIALLDIKMDGIDGLELLRVLREESRTTECIILTGFSELDVALSALKLGAREFLTKPIGSEELILRVKSVWRARNAETRLRIMQEKYSSKVFNDLLTPLNSIKAALDYLVSAGADPLSPQQRKLIATITETTGGMEEMLNDMIDLSLYETERAEIEHIPTNLDELVPAICAQFNSRSQARQITIAVDVAPNIPTVEIDPNKIGHVIKHLIEHAFLHAPQGGNVGVRVSMNQECENDKPKEFVEVSITDPGTPIPKGELLLIFDKYKDVLTEKRSELLPNGLRFPICKSIIEAHRGTISAESDKNRGTTLSFRLPITT